MTDEREIVLQLRDVSKKIGKRVIIDQLSFDLYKGEVLGFLGPNGSGKTTTIRMIVGLISMTSGDIFIRGNSVRDHYTKAIKYVGAIVENPEMYKFLSGYQNLLHYARMVPGITEQRIREVVDLVGLQGRIHDKVKRYSLGMRQRLGVAQALLHKPSVLILDEPTNGLDPAGIRELRDYLRYLAKEEEIAVLVSSHLLSEIELMCDRVVIIQAGKMIDTRDLNEHQQTTVDHTAVQSVTFEVDQPEVALQHIDPQYILQVDEQGHIHVQANREMVARMNQQLVHNGVSVYQIRTLHKTLEDQFLELTGGAEIV